LPSCAAPGAGVAEVRLCTAASTGAGVHSNSQGGGRPLPPPGGPGLSAGGHEAWGGKSLSVMGGGVCVHVCMHVLGCVSVYMWIYVPGCVCARVRACVCGCVGGCVCVGVWVGVCMFMYTYVHTVVCVCLDDWRFGVVVSDFRSCRCTSGHSLSRPLGAFVCPSVCAWVGLVSPQEENSWVCERRPLQPRGWPGHRPRQQDRRLPHAGAGAPRFLFFGGSCFFFFYVKLESPTGFLTRSNPPPHPPLLVLLQPQWDRNGTSPTVLTPRSERDLCLSNRYVQPLP